MHKDRRDAKMDPAVPCGNLRHPAVLNKLQISRSGLLFDVNKQLSCAGMRTARGRTGDCEESRGIVWMKTEGLS